VSNVTGTANQAWQNTGGAAVNTVTHNGDPLCIATLAVPGACGLIHAAEENPAAAALWVGTGAACAVGLLTELPAKYLCAPLGGVLGYTLGNAAANVANGRDPTAGWNVADATVYGAAGLLLVGVGDVGVGAAFGLGFVAGGAADAFSQWKDHPDRPIDWNHVRCAAMIGGAGNVPVFGGPAKAFAWNLIQSSLGALGCKDY
jgi:hypothetical protein